jgi:NAD+ kinase
MSGFKKIAIVANRDKPGAGALASELAHVVEREGATAVLPLGHPLPPDALAGCDACVVLGGDGTLLGVVAQAAVLGVPVLGINRGKLGFLANYPAANAAESLLAVLRGDFQISQRTLLECRAEGIPGRLLALNDVVVAPRSRSHMARFKVSVDGEFVNSFLCDGVIVTTPTGSTAYNLSAGGPLIDPGAEVLAVTPVCPHTLSNRALILPASRKLFLECENAGAPLSIAVDGVPMPHSENVFPVEISLAREKFALLQPPGFSHFSLLRSKLRWA